MSKSEVILNVTMQAVRSRDTELETLLHDLQRSTRLEPGCVAYEIHRSSEKTDSFMLYERFKDQAALDAHVQSDHFQEFLKQRAAGVDPVAASEVTRWRTIED